MPNSENPPIMVYPPNTEDFSKNGLCILTPTSAEVELKDDSAHTLHLVHPVDDAGNWKFLKISAILNVPIRFRDEIIYEPLRIVKIKKERSGNKAQITVDARHIFYDNGYVIVPYADIQQKNCLQAMQTIFSSFYHPTGYAQACERFRFSSDIAELKDIVYEKKSIVACLIGETNSIINTYGGSLYVHGNYFSINKEKEKSRKLAFSLKYGLNISGISATYDSEKSYSALYSESSSGATLGRSVSAKEMGLAYDKTAYKKFSYDKNSPESQFASDTDLYFKEISNISASYTVSFADLKAYEEYSDVKNLATCEVGDTGTVYDEELDIYTVQKIISKKIDIINQMTTSVILGSFIPSIADLDKYKNNVFSTVSGSGGASVRGNSLVIKN